MKSLHNLFDLADALDAQYRDWMENHNLPLSIFSPVSPFRRPLYALLSICIVLLVIAPAIICLIAGTAFKSNIAFVAMAIYIAIIVVAFITTLVYVIVTAIKNQKRKGL